MANFVTLKVEYGPSIDVAVEKIVVRETNEYLGVGGRIADVRFPSGELKEGCQISITKNKDKKEVLHVDGEPIAQSEFSKHEYCSNNHDY